MEFRVWTGEEMIYDACQCREGVLMASTGIFDKHGKEIYEYDIIRTTRGNLFYIRPLRDYIIRKTYLSMNYLRYGEIEGNKWEDPELYKTATRHL